MPAHTFDDKNIKWEKFLDLDHLLLSILDVDKQHKIAHVLFKFAAGQQVVLHRHVALNKLFVVQGEHRLYHPNRELKEIRSVGSYTVSPASADPHREGGGPDQDVIIYFTIYGDQEKLYEILDDDFNVVATVGFQDVVQLFDGK